MTTRSRLVLHLYAVSPDRLQGMLIAELYPPSEASANDLVERVADGLLPAEDWTLYVNPPWAGPMYSLTGWDHRATTAWPPNDPITRYEKETNR
jgi:hypothetical protein